MIRGINDDKAINYETAIEIINTTIGRLLSEISTEAKKSTPNTSLITDLQQQCDKLILKRRHLDPDDTTAVAQIMNSCVPPTREPNSTSDTN